ncbi:MAG: FtsW/RodA/SpoVE family cell cycle protein, partial [Actinomycetota bacterium]|nr:FtsW/RodA/SpoVE family cell cycle protein [Actinomycetota bacterium]
PKRLLAALLALGVAGVVAAFTTPVLSAYQRDRLTAFLDPGADPQGIGYQTRQVRIAIGSGGWSGQGLLSGRQTQGGFIPFQQTDFVFSVAGEELGFLGSAGLVLLLAFLILRTIIVGGRSDAFGQLVAVGVALWFAVQAFENIGMNLGIMPVTGLPLPFLSYGGSSMFVGWLALGLVNNVHLSRVMPR